MLPDRALPVVLQVAQPIGGFDQYRAAPYTGVGKRHTIRGFAKADLLLRQAAFCSARSACLGWDFDLPALDRLIQGSGFCFRLDPQFFAEQLDTFLVLAQGGRVLVRPGVELH